MRVLSVWLLAVEHGSMRVFPSVQVRQRPPGPHLPEPAVQHEEEVQVRVPPAALSRAGVALSEAGAEKSQQPEAVGLTAAVNVFLAWTAEVCQSPVVTSSSL